MQTIQMHMRASLITFVLLLIGSKLSYGQVIFRSSSDSVQYEKLRFQIAENMKNDPKRDNEELHLLREMLVVKAIPAHKRGAYTFYENLLQSGRRDTIRRLGLYNVSIKHLPEAVQQCSNLIELDISACRIGKLPKWISTLKHLETIVLTKSNVKKFKVRTLPNQSVKHLDLSHNNIRRIPRGIRNLDSLEYLNLSGNRIRRLQFLRQCAALSYINISYNRVRRNKLTLRSNPNLLGINLSHNQLTDLPFSLANFESLQELNLSYNKIEKIESCIGSNRLRVLSLYNNRLDHIPEKILQLSNLTSLDLSFNLIQVVSPDIRNLKDLSFLSLSDNQLTIVPKEIGTLMQLKSLFLKNNQLTGLPESLCDLRLTKLDVGFNKLRDFPLCVLNNKGLEELYVNDNLIERVPDELSAMRRLWIFYFDGNLVARDSEPIRALVKALRDKGVEVKY